MKKKLILTIMACVAIIVAQADNRYNFNAGWKLHVEKNLKGADKPDFDDAGWKNVTLPRAWNQEEAFSCHGRDASDSIAWYRKTFTLTKEMKQGKKFFIEFEGVRQGAHVWLNGHELGWSDNGVMAFGFDMTPYINKEGKNVLAVWTDNSWRYKEHNETISEKGKPQHSGFQWNDRNFYANYGGINKNVWIHVMGDIYQTLPLYSNLGTTGIYIYAKNYDVKGRKALIHAESEVKNESPKDVNITYEVTIKDKGGKQVALFKGKPQTVKAGTTATLSAEQTVEGLHFWSWGYGYLYDVETALVANGKTIDSKTTRTGFRKTEYGKGEFKLNDRTLQVKGFAQRSTNEWPALGQSMPVWMSDYSNRMVLGCNGNLFRWMHVTPMKQDVESFDRLGLLQAMPAGDSEKDIKGRRWQQRVEVMRDAIIYNRNNPSVIFYECGNNQINEEHMAEMKAVRDQYDPYGGRAIGSRNMLDSKEAEYGGEMLYINKSAEKPMWMMEYMRDEAIRRYWDQWSYPYHIEGDGPLFRGSRAVSYNRNQDGLAVQNVVRWNEYWLARPGTGKRINSGGTRIIFSDSNTHARGEKSYRTSGNVDPMRLPKDSWYVHQAIWDGWVDTEKDHTYIIGHWNYENGDKDGKAVVKPVYVVSTGDEVELFLNGKSLGKGERSETFLFTFNDVKWQPGKLEAVGHKNGKEVARHAIETVGEPVALSMKWVEAPETFRADGHDVRIAEVEAVDKQGRRHPIAHDMLTFDLKGEGEWLGGVSGDAADSLDNRILSKNLALEAGVCRVMVRSTTNAGSMTLTAKAKGFKDAELSISTTATPQRDGFYVDAQGNAIEADWSKELPAYMDRGETPLTPSYTQKFQGVAIKSVDAKVNAEDVQKMYDDNEASKWVSDGHLENTELTFHLERKANIKHVVMRLEGFRKTSYPLEIIDSKGEVVFQGYTEKSLGYVYLPLKQTGAHDTYKVRMVGPASVKEAFGDVTEIAAKKAVSTKASKSNKLSIIEIEFNE